MRVDYININMRPGGTINRMPKVLTKLTAMSEAAGRDGYGRTVILVVT